MAKSPQQARVEAAFSELLRALGVEVAGDFAKTPERATELWLSYLLQGQHADPAVALGQGAKSTARAPVWVRDMGVHLVCPHHLTIAFGNAHVGYVPRGRVVGFGALARLLETCTARFVLQEEAAQLVADTLVNHLGAKAAVCSIDAVHPCHNVLHGRSHAAHAVSLGVAGDEKTAQALTRSMGLTTARPKTKASGPRPRSKAR